MGLSSPLVGMAGPNQFRVGGRPDPFRMSQESVAANTPEAHAAVAANRQSNMGHFGSQPGGNSPISGLGGLFGALSPGGGGGFFGGLGKGGPAPFHNPFQPNSSNPFLTGQFAPTSFDPFTSGGIATGNLGVGTDRNNNLTKITPPVSPFRNGVGTRNAGRGLLDRANVSGRRGGLGGFSPRHAR
jgi:hypothetical protein